MKKKMIALLAGALMMLSASSAFAFVSANLELYRVVYDGTTGSTFETMTDLGSLLSIQAKAAGTLLDSGTSAFINSAGYSTSSTGNYRIAYFAIDQTNSSMYMSQTGEAAAPTVMTSKFASAGSPLKSAVTFNYAKTTGVTKDASGMTATYTTGTGNVNSFRSKEGGTLNAYTFGQYFLPADGLKASPNLSNVSLTDLTTIYLFSGDYGATGVAQFKLTTDVVHGTTNFAGNVATTPIPAAIYLMGSGLLGMFGLRRKQRG